MTSGSAKQSQPASPEGAFPWMEIVAIALVCFWLEVYIYGIGNHYEQLPGIMRWLDPGLFVRDLDVGPALDYGGRYFFYALCAPLAAIIGLWQTYLVLAILVWLGWALALGWLCWSGLKISRDATLLSVLLIVCGAPFSLGATSGNQAPALIPASVSWPFLVLMLLFAWRDRWLPVLILGVVAALFQPLLGAGAIALLAGVAVMVAWLDRRRAPVAVRRFWQPVAAMAAFGLAYAGLWIVPLFGKGEMPANLADILIPVIPQHLSPAYFWRAETPGILSAFAAFALAGWGVGRLGVSAADGLLRYTLAVFGIALAMWFVGVIGVEIMRSNFITVAQVFRMCFLPSWLGSIIIALFAATSLRQHPLVSIPSLFVIIGGFVAQDALTILLGVMALVSFRVLDRWPRLVWVVTVLLITVGGLRLIDVAWKRHLALMVALGGFVLLMRLVPNRTLAGRFSLAAALVCSALCIASSGHSWPLFPPTALRLEDHHEDIDGVARYARAHTARTELFLTPPRGGRFRLVAERAVVVANMPQRPDLLLEMHSRLIACYGTAELQLPAPQLEAGYRGMTDARLRALAARYGFEKAVLFKETATAFPVLYADAAYKLVDVGASQPAR